MRLPFIVIAGLLALVSSAQQLPPVPAESRHFDFWIGVWEVTTPDGKVAGRNDIKSILGGRVLQENYTTPGAFAGHSYNSYNAPKKQWEQFWVDNSGTVLHLVGGVNEQGQMVLSGDRVTPQGDTVKDRITWTPNDDGTVRQHWEMSTDGGEVWSTLFDGTYTRIEASEDPA
ncbi:MAG: hypothetical protein SynsKO_11230 [Synoicihabitans sp.]